MDNEERALLSYLFFSAQNGPGVVFISISPDPAGPAGPVFVHLYQPGHPHPDVLCGGPTDRCGATNGASWVGSPGDGSEKRHGRFNQKRTTLISWYGHLS